LQDQFHRQLRQWDEWPEHWLHSALALLVQAQKKRRGMSTVGRTQLFKDARELISHCLLATKDLDGDLLIGVAMNT
jgi:hypothetical protein